MIPEERIELQKAEQEKARQRGREAKALLDNPLFQEVWNSGHDFWIRRFTEEQDPHKRDDIWRALRVFVVVKDQFEGLVKAGQTADVINLQAEKRVIEATRSGRRHGA